MTSPCAGTSPSCTCMTIGFRTSATWALPPTSPTCSCRTTPSLTSRTWRTCSSSPNCECRVCRSLQTIGRWSSVFRCAGIWVGTGLQWWRGWNTSANSRNSTWRIRGCRQGRSCSLTPDLSSRWPYDLLFPLHPSNRGPSSLCIWKKNLMFFQPRFT